MTPAETKVIENVIARLRGAHDANPEINALLTGPCRLYLETWVTSALDILIHPDRDKRSMSLALELSRVNPQPLDRYRETVNLHLQRLGVPAATEDEIRPLHERSFSPDAAAMAIGRDQADGRRRAAQA
jgi:hypothetical protein